MIDPETGEVLKWHRGIVMPELVFEALMALRFDLARAGLTRLDYCYEIEKDGDNYRLQLYNFRPLETKLKKGPGYGVSPSQAGDPRQRRGGSPKPAGSKT